MSKPLIAVFRGGFSGESVISHQSADQMMAALDSDRFDAVFISIDAKAWECSRANGEAIALDRSDLSIGSGTGKRRPAAALIAIHGSPGEDGKLQGYLDLLGIPYQTGDVLNMSLTFSKSATIAMLKQQGFPVAPSLLLHRHSTIETGRLIGMGLPLFVKPDRSGSSLGVTKVKKAEELEKAIEDAFAECDQILVEAAISGRELTCGVLSINGEVKALPICEIRTSREFFDYEAKYHATDTEEIVPAPLPDTITAMVQERSVAIYKAFNCKGMVRVDHFWTGGNEPDDVITIELNTVPGFSKASIFPKMIAAAGMGVEEVVNELVAGLVG